MTNCINPNEVGYWANVQHAYRMIRTIEQIHQIEYADAQRKPDDFWGGQLAFITEASMNSIVKRILTAQGRTHLLLPEVHFLQDEHDMPGLTHRRRLSYILTSEGLVKITEKTVAHEEASTHEYKSYLNGLLHDHDGKPAVSAYESYRILSEQHMDCDYEVSYRHGVEINYLDKDSTCFICGCETSDPHHTLHGETMCGSCYDKNANSHFCARCDSRYTGDHCGCTVSEAQHSSNDNMAHSIALPF